jgi:hypothetical protein
MTLRGPYARDYISREVALSIVEALKTADGWREVEALTGTSEAQDAAHRAFLIYGYPELDPSALALWTASAFDRRMSGNTQASHNGTPDDTPDPTDHGYGFGRAQ